MSVGDGAAGAAIQIMDQRSKTIDQISELITRILENMTRRSDFTKEDNRGIKNLMKHLENGRNIDVTPVFKEDENILDEILRSMKIPFVIGMDHKEDKMLLMTRDQDRDSLKDVLSRYAIRKGMETREVAIEDLLGSFKGKEIRIEKGLEAAEVELFREKAKDNDCVFSVISSKEKNGLYELAYPCENGKACENVLKDVAYDFSGEEGRKYKARVIENIRKRQEFIENLKPKDDDILYICAKEDPSKFLSVTRDVCAVHSIQVMKDGHAKDREARLYDSSKVICNSFERKELQRQLDQMKDPVVFTPEEFGIVKSISISGKASFVQGDEFRERYQVLCEMLKCRSGVYPVSIIESDSPTSKKVVSYVNLTGPQLDGIQEKLKVNRCERYLVTGYDDNGISVAFPKSLSERMKPVIEGVLYGNAKGIELMQKKLLYGGRGSLDIHKSEDIIVDVSVPGVALFFEENRLDIVQRQDIDEKDTEGVNRKEHDRKDIILMSIDRSDPDFDRKVIHLVGLMDNPVVIKKDKYKKNSRAELASIIRARIPSEHKSKALSEYEEYLKNQRQSIYDQLHERTDDQRNIDMLTERQKEALRKHFSRQFEDIYLSGSVFSGTGANDKTNQSNERGVDHAYVYGQELASVH